MHSDSPHVYYTICVVMSIIASHNLMVQFGSLQQYNAPKRVTARNIAEYRQNSAKWNVMIKPIIYSLNTNAQMYYTYKHFITHTHTHIYISQLRFKYSLPFPNRPQANHQSSIMHDLMSIINYAWSNVSDVNIKRNWLYPSRKAIHINVCDKLIGIQLNCLHY